MTGCKKGVIMNNFRYMLKMLSVSVLTVAAAAVMTGCGSSKLPEGYWKLCEVTEGKETVKEDDLSEYGLEETYVVSDDSGNGYAVIFGSSADFTADTEDGTLGFNTGDVSYSVSGKKLTLADSKLKMVFEKSKDDAPAKPAAVAASAASPSASGAASRPENVVSDPDNFFAGDWYGWWTIDSNTDFWNDLDGEMFDVLCEVKMNDDETGVLTLWDAEMPYNEPIARVNVRLSDGMLVSEDGFFLDGQIGQSTWMLMPEANGISDYMMITSHYIDGDGEDAMTYTFHLKKWGASWDDFGTLPPQYDWYESMVDAGESMPDTLPE